MDRLHHTSFSAILENKKPAKWLVLLGGIHHCDGLVIPKSITANLTYYDLLAVAWYNKMYNDEMPCSTALRLWAHRWEQDHVTDSMSVSEQHH